MRKNYLFAKNFGMMLCKAKDADKPEAGGVPAAPANAGTAAEQDSEDNIEASIDKGVTLTEEVAQKAAEQIAKENKERRVEETKRLMMRSGYVRGKQLLVLRREKRRKIVAKEYLTALSNLDEELKAGKHDETSYEKAFKEAYKKREESYREADKKYSEYCEKLRKQYPGYWTWSWDNCID